MTRLIARLFPFFILAGFPLAAAADVAPQTEIVCINCHGTLPGRLGEPVKFWRGSIHAANGIACNDCHGGDPKDATNAMSPARGFRGAPKETVVPEFCGRCHVGVLKDYQQSAHGRALGKGGPNCVTCHSNHLVVKATIDIINEKTCTQCHSFERARTIKEAMQQTETMIVSIGNRIEGFKNEGIDTDSLEKRLFSVRNSFHSLFHDVDVEKVKRESARIDGDLKTISGSLDLISRQQQKRRLAGGFVVGGALLASILLYLLRRTYD
ncbi:MAG TPA: cytochrome c3 family protein [Geobacteraceae bacterium]|nr:cytochrome c3 family protein [Geobacteraceae bacterium]